MFTTTSLSRSARSTLPTSVARVTVGVVGFKIEAAKELPGVVVEVFFKIEA